MWDEGWKPGKWSDEEILEVAFTEPFHAYGLGDDYYFVTETGKVYFSPPLKSGETGPRKVRPLWTDGKQPVTHLVTHVDDDTPNLTYAFGEAAAPAKNREKFYFKLQGAEAKLTYFSPKQLQSAELQEPLKTLLEYSRLIVNGPLPLPPEPEAEQTAGPDAAGNAWWIMGGVLGALVIAGAGYALWRRVAA
jgi:hypothetical protein